MRSAQFRALIKILNYVQIPDYIYAFEKRKSIPIMAANHVNKAVVISVDLKDFFHSIKQRKLYTIFRDLGIGEKPARTLSEICTVKSFVPQGALTSPKIANIITAATFGPEVKQYCDEKGLTLSIYADDITVSSSTDIDAREVIEFLVTTVSRNGFRINHEKTKVMRRTTRQYVCGVVVNAKTNMLKKERYKLRAIVHNITVNGLEAEAQKMNLPSEQFANHIRGRLNWLKQLNPALGAKNIEKLKEYLDRVKQESTAEQIAAYTLLVEEPQQITETPILDASIEPSSDKEDTTKDLPWQ